VIIENSEDPTNEKSGPKNRRHKKGRGEGSELLEGPPSDDWGQNARRRNRHSEGRKKVVKEIGLWDKVKRSCAETSMIFAEGESGGD